MRPIVVSKTGTGSSTVVPLDYHGLPQISLQVVTSGTVNWTVQQTLDDPASSPTWFNHSDTNMVSQTGNKQGNYAYVPRAVKIVVNSGDGTATLTVIQAGVFKS